MLNQKIRGMVESATPFAFNDGDDVRHGITITLKTLVKHDFMDDVVDVTFREPMQKLLLYEPPLTGSFKLKLPVLSDLAIRFPNVLKSVPCELTEIMANAIIGEHTEVNLKLKMKDLNVSAKGTICDTLRTEIDVTLVTMNYKLDLQPPPAEEPKKPKKTARKKATQ